MQVINRRQVPLGILLIAAFYVFGAIVLLVTVVTNPIETSQAIAERHGLPPAIGTAILPLVAGLALVIAYGLISLSRWGFFLTVAYLLYFATISLARGGLSFAWTGSPEMQVYFGNLLWAVLALVYLLIVVRNRFLAR